MTIEFLLRERVRIDDSDALEMAEVTLQKMAQGGMYDQLGGGFARYSVDHRWLVPHFEKMLYDNAQLARVYLHAWQITGNELLPPNRRGNPRLRPARNAPRRRRFLQQPGCR